MQIAAGYAAGATFAELAVRYAMSLPRVAQIVHSMGLTRADGGASTRARLRRQARGGR